MTSSVKVVGRLRFASQILLISVFEVGLEYLIRRNALINLNGLPRQFRALPDLAVFFAAAIFLGRTINNRLVDTGLPTWYSYPAFTVWLLSTQLPVVWIGTWPTALTLFVLLLIAGSLIPGVEASAGPAPLHNFLDGERKTDTSDKRIPQRLLVGQIGFLRTILTLACFGFPLIYLERSLGRGIGAAIAEIGCGILYFVWVLKVLGRFADSGRSSNLYWFPFCVAATVVSALPLRLKLINSYEALTLFLLIQVPLALLKSKPRPEEPARPQKNPTEYQRKLELRRRAAKPFLVGPSVFLFRLFVIACFWAPLIYLQNASSNGVAMWFARCGYFILIFAWMMNTNGRFVDAGWAHNWFPSQYGLVVSVASLMPLAAHWVNAYGALAIFVLIQVPTVFLRSKPRPGRGW